MDLIEDECPCCLGDPDIVCDACGDHACWAGIYMCRAGIWMCQDSYTAGTCTAAEYAARNTKSAS